MSLFDGSVSAGTLALLLLCLAIALAFEFVNGFHDTANAVATVIYTRSLKPGWAVTWSGLMNFLGVLLGGTAVAFSIVHLLPVDLLINIGSTVGLKMVLSMLLAAIVWNFGTWYLGLPASSSHALIGSILGVGLASSLYSGAGFGSGVNWDKARQVWMSLLVSPLLGFALAATLLLLAQRLVRDPRINEVPVGDRPPPWWIRGILIGTCTGVSFAHGSNDGQKGIGLIMLILVGILPMQYALNPKFEAERRQQAVVELAQVEPLMMRLEKDGLEPSFHDAAERVRAVFTSGQDPQKLPSEARVALRASILLLDDELHRLEMAHAAQLQAEERALIKRVRSHLRDAVDFVASWVVLAVALALGIGTTVGWKRIVVTVGEKIGKSHLTYAQGAAAEVVAMGTIAAADAFGLPVSTTHVLSSGVAGTMAASRSGLQAKTVRNIALAWVLTMPATLVLSGTLFVLSARSEMKEIGARAKVKPRPARVEPRLE